MTTDFLPNGFLRANRLLNGAISPEVRMGPIKIAQRSLVIPLNRQTTPTILKVAVQEGIMNMNNINVSNGARHETRDNILFKCISVMQGIIPYNSSFMDIQTINLLAVRNVIEKMVNEST